MAECGPIDAGCKASAALGGVTDDLTADIKAGVEMFIEGTFTGWLNMPVPLIGADFGVVSFLRENLAALSGLLLTFAVILFAGKLIFAPNKDTIQGGGAFLLRVMVVTGGSVYIGAQLVKAADGYSSWIIDQATAGDGLATTVLNIFQVTGSAGFFIALIFGLAAVCLSIIQGFLLAARNVILPILVGVAPVVVAVSNTEAGKSWWTKYISWFTAFLLYKPTAATIYAAGFWLLGEGDIIGSQNLGELVISGMNFTYGFMLLFMSVIALSALMNVVTPVTGKLTGGMAGAAMMAVSGAALLASGAVGRAASAVPALASPTTATIIGESGGGSTTGARGNPTSKAQFAGDFLSQSQRGFSESLNNDKDDK